jgi:putative transposase
VLQSLGFSGIPAPGFGNRADGSPRSHNKSESRYLSDCRTAWPSAGHEAPQRLKIWTFDAGIVLVKPVEMLPRQVLPGQFYLVTRRCTQRQFLLRPDPATNNAFTYCLIDAAQRAQIDIVLPCAMSNHYHAVIFDRYGRYPEFVEHFHKMFARSQNVLRGRLENFWSSDQVCVVRLVDREDVIDKLVYTATNPVKDGLVDKVHHWPGVNGLGALLGGRPLQADRPRHFFRHQGAMPGSLELRLRIPPELGPEVEVLKELRERVATAEAAFAAARNQTGHRVRGRRAVLQQPWWDHPTTVEPRHNLRPQVAARNKWSRIEALRRNRAFVHDYLAARDAWLAGGVVCFPPGTWWLARYARVPITATSQRPPK